MFLNSPERTLEVSFRVTHGENSFMVYSSTESLRCFECRDLGHKRFACPHKDERRASTSQAETNNLETQRSQERATDQVIVQHEVSELNVNTGDEEKAGCSTAFNTAVSKAVSECDDAKAQSGSEDRAAGQAGGDLVDDMEDLSQCTDGGLRDDDDDERWSDVAKIADKDLYSLKQIISFLDQTKGKAGVKIGDFFPDTEKFVNSVVLARKTYSYDDLSQQKRFRLNKHLTAIRSGRQKESLRG